MKRKYFGTDGIRGTANIEPMTPETALKAAMATAHALRGGDHRHKVVIGKDTRLSGYLIEPAMTSGFISMGMDVVLLGPIPTPAVAMLTRSLRADLGVMISASHNPFEDNGIKLFGADGYKLSDDMELQIERLMDDPNLVDYRAAPENLGRAARLEDESGRYIEHAKATFPKNLRLDGMKIVLDCANGAAYKVAPKVLWELGADVIAMSTDPNGFNINKNCGATSTDALCKAVVQHQADVGIALDGDADRIFMCDEKGQVVDGDQLMALIAKYWKASGQLKGDAVVATVMSNLGFERYLKSNGMDMKRMPVGDRYVVDHMRSNNYNLGGEQSGHIVLGDYGTTGDGTLAALQILAILRQENKKASEVCRVYEPVPQFMNNVRFKHNIDLDTPEVEGYLMHIESRLDGKGRILVRKSGTEPLIRVMAEGDDKNLIQDTVDEISAWLLERDMPKESTTEDTVQSDTATSA